MSGVPVPITLDIETVPTDEALNALYPEETRNPPANYKSEEAIARWRITDRAAWEADRVKACSLNPRLGRILCVGMQRVDEEKVDVVTAFSPSSEQTLVQSVLDALASAEGEVVTWNGAFDLRFLLVRAMILRCHVPAVLARQVPYWFRKYSYYPHFDCKAALLNWDVRVSGEGLDEWSKALGVGGKTAGVTGADVYPMYKDAKYAEIREYCAQDVRSTTAVYRVVAPYFGAVLSPVELEVVREAGL